jgi:hypothetical protein
MDEGGSRVSGWVAGDSTSLSDEGDGEGVGCCAVGEVHVVGAAVSDAVWVVGAVVTLVAGVWFRWLVLGSSIYTVVFGITYFR